MKILYLPNEYSQQRQKEKPANIYPIRMAMEAEYYRQEGHDVSWGHNEEMKSQFLLDKVIREPEMLPFLDLPAPDRIFTKAKDYTSGNYKYLPGTHMLSASGCWWGKCSFCVERGQKYEVRSVDSVIDEMVEIQKLGFKEVFDDSGTFPDGEWLKEFCFKKRFLFRDFPISCNMRIGADVDFKMMKDAGFRMLLFGVESANQKTLNKINKGVKYETIIPTIKQAAKAGLAPHIAVMFGYPWEEDRDSDKTLSLVHTLLTKGYAKTAQASFFICEQEISNFAGKKYVKRIYEVGYNPLFWCRRILNIKNMADLKYLGRQIKEGLKNV